MSKNWLGQNTKERGVSGRKSCTGSYSTVLYFNDIIRYGSNGDGWKAWESGVDGLPLKLQHVPQVCSISEQSSQNSQNSPETSISE